MTISRSSNERGVALLVVTIIGLALFSIWGMAAGAMMSSIDTESYLDQKRERDFLLNTALASGVELLRTGVPPSSPFGCIFYVGGEPEARPCTVLYESQASADRWSVLARPSTPEDLQVFQVAPHSFAAGPVIGVSGTGGRQGVGPGRK